MNEENIKKLKDLMIKEDDLKTRFYLLKKSFEESNADLINELVTIGNGISECKQIARENAEVGFLKDHEKKRYGGIGIREGVSYDYDVQTALEWSKVNMPVAVETVLNSKLFEGFIKTNDLDFVKKTPKITVTFPKEIVF